MKPYALVCTLLTLAACSPKPQPAKEAASAPAAPSPAATEAPAGLYELDPAHTSVVFRVNHLGLSRYTARFAKVDAQLRFDPDKPAASTVSVRIDPRSIRTDYPGANLDFDAQIAGTQFLDAEHFPQIAFHSTGIDLTGADTARVAGELELHGVTRPITLDTTFNGFAGGPGSPMGERIGFSARAAIKRSDFGMSYGLPPAGSTLGVGDEVEIQIEAEFLRKAAPPAP